MRAHGWYVAPEVAPLEFTIRQDPEHFRVFEERVQPPAGEGEHLHVHIEKRDLTTPRAVRILCQALGVPVRRAGVSGRKDKRAVTRQWVSIQGGQAEKLQRLHSTHLQVLEWGYDRRKLRRGEHAGNRFALFLHGLDPARRDDLERVLDALQHRGLPNLFGEQRYGASGANARFGRALWLQDAEAALEAYGQTQIPRDRAEPPSWGQWLAGETPAKAPSAWVEEGWPAALAALAKEPWPTAWSGVVQRIPRAERRFAMQAAQSALFDQWLLLRAQADALFGPPLPGDCLGRVGERDQPIASGAEAAFPAGDAPLGPLFGPSMNQSRDRAREWERATLQAADWSEACFQKDAPADPDRPRGSRRPMLVAVEEVAIDWEPGGAWLAFRLPPGAYATTLLMQLRKDFQPPSW